MEKKRLLCRFHWPNQTNKAEVIEQYKPYEVGLVDYMMAPRHVMADQDHGVHLGNQQFESHLY